MNKKLVYSISLLGLTLLTACSQHTSKEQENATPPSLEQSKLTTESFKAITAHSGLFSIEVPSNWSENDADDTNDLSVHSPANDYFMIANTYPKADTPLSLQEFATSIIQHSSDTAGSDVQLTNTIIADKNGYFFTKELNPQKQILLFFYEDGDAYHLINFISHPDMKSQIQGFLTQAILSWKTLSTQKTFQLAFDQVVTLPNTSMTVNLPTTWTQDTTTSTADTVTYQNTADNIYLAIRALSTSGYTVDLAEVTDQLVGQEASSPKQEVTIGNHQGYRVQFTQTAANHFNYTYTVYVFHINETLVTFTFTSRTSDTEALQPAMETIISSLK